MRDEARTTRCEVRRKKRNSLRARHKHLVAGQAGMLTRLEDPARLPIGDWSAPISAKLQRGSRSCDVFQSLPQSDEWGTHVSTKQSHAEPTAHALHPSRPILDPSQVNHPITGLIHTKIQPR